MERRGRARTTTGQDGAPAAVVVDDDVPPPGFDDVYGAERERIVRLAYLLVRSSPVAEDLAQEAFVVLYERFATVDNPPGFLRTVVVRLALRWLHRHDLERRRLAVASGGEDPTAGPPEPPDETWAALGRLAPERRAVIVLRFYEDLDFGRIGELLACSAATARSRTRRALNDLRKELS
jgi:RNA polymerase sigma factor (sigma-70 family)